MDELTKIVMQKTGLSQDQAKAAITAVIDFLKTKLPGSMAGQIDGVLGGANPMGDIAKDVGGLLGKKS